MTVAPLTTVMFTVRVDGMVIGDVIVIEQDAPNWTVPPASTSVRNVEKVHGVVTVPGVGPTADRGSFEAATVGEATIVGTSATSRTKVANAISAKVAGPFDVFDICLPGAAGPESRYLAASRCVSPRRAPVGRNGAPSLPSRTSALRALPVRGGDSRRCRRVPFVFRTARREEGWGVPEAEDSEPFHDLRFGFLAWERSGEGGPK
ncbi:MAG: hypothetical protein L3K00_01095 [Thermoplasmata archaeon]|nr:hypothetical protein [Thermoplasmata archaeon]